MNKEEVRAWLLRYAWLGTEEEQAREVDCILSQDEWRYLDVTADRFDDANSDTGEAPGITGDEFALSALYECHDEPHQVYCPRRKSVA